MFWASPPSELERHVRDETLKLDCLICGYFPVQADGKLDGHPLYFRARCGWWSFTLCANADVDPSYLRSGEKPGFFIDGDYIRYELTCEYGSQNEASYMPYDIAERFIRICALRYFIDRNKA